MKQRRRVTRAIVAGVLGVLLVTACATGIPEEQVAEVYFKLGNAYFDLGEFDNAVNAYTQALELDASLARAGYNLAHVYLETDRIAEAKRLLLDLLDEDPENGLITSTLAWAYYREGDLERALEMYERVTDRFPGDADARYNTAMLLWELEQYEEALDEFLALYEIDPSREYLPALSKLYAETGDVDRAIRYLELYLAEDEEATEERIELAELYADAKDYGRAVATYDEVIERLESPPVEALFEQARILLVYIEDYESGVAALQGAITAGFRNGEAILDMTEELPDQVSFEIKEIAEGAGLFDEEEKTPSGSNEESDSAGM